MRLEYPHAWEVLHTTIGKAEAAGFLGDHICNSGKAFHLELRMGAGAYICGEETSLLDSLEGKRGKVRARQDLDYITKLACINDTKSPLSSLN